MFTKFFSLQDQTLFSTYSKNIFVEENYRVVLDDPNPKKHPIIFGQPQDHDIVFGQPTIHDITLDTQKSIDEETIDIKKNGDVLLATLKKNKIEAFIDEKISKLQKELLITLPSSIQYKKREIEILIWQITKNKILENLEQANLTEGSYICGLVSEEVTNRVNSSFKGRYTNESSTTWREIKSFVDDNLNTIVVKAVQKLDKE